VISVVDKSEVKNISGTIPICSNQIEISGADPAGCAVEGVGLWSLPYLHCGFESHRGHGCLLCMLCIVA